jgi:hypothetical protein
MALDFRPTACLPAILFEPGFWFELCCDFSDRELFTGRLKYQLRVSRAA